MVTKPSETTRAAAIAPEQLAERPSYADIGLKDAFAKMVYAFKECDAKIAALKAKREEYSDKIMEQLGRTGATKVEVDDYNVAIVDADRTRLDLDKLMEQGVECVHCGERTSISAGDIEAARVPVPHNAYVLITAKKREAASRKVTAIKK